MLILALAAALAGGVPGLTRPITVEEGFARTDPTNRGYYTWPEDERGSWEGMLRRDANGDGKIDRAEYTAHCHEHPAYEQMCRYGRYGLGSIFQSLDRNHDGFLDRGEIARQSRVFFVGYDKNSDGKVTRAEAGLPPMPK